MGRRPRNATNMTGGMTGAKKAGWRSKAPRGLPEDGPVVSQPPPKHLCLGGRLSSGAAVVVRCVIDRLRLLCKYLHGLARRRGISTSVIPVADQLVVKEERPPAHLHRGRRHHTFKPEPLRRPVRRPSVMTVDEPPRPPTPPVVVNGHSVTKEVEAQYREYFRLSTLTPESSVLCHMCFFEMQRHENNTVLKSKILWHCSRKHTIGFPCEVDGCKVRVPTAHDLELHKHFCHARLP